jgi:hypothetical protein
MKTSPQVINAKDALPQLPARDEQVQKIVLGDLDTQQAWDGIEAALSAHGGFAARFPNLTHLYLWRLAGLRRLPDLPATLQVLDIRDCPDLERVPTLHDQLERLIVQGCPRVTALECAGPGLPKLIELCLRDSTELQDDAIRSLVSSAPALQWLDVSGCTKLRRLSKWASSLLDVRINGCGEFGAMSGAKLPSWPKALRRLELRNTAILDLPPVPSTLDYVDLQGCKSLRHLPLALDPEQGWHPRTLFIHGSGLELPDVLFGAADENRARQVIAHRDNPRQPLHEVKVILLGDGRAGKSSLARRLNKQPFDANERTTHGIRLWSLPQHPFQPIDQPDVQASACVHLWDFAGQDMYHSTHRLFYQSRAIYVVCETAAGPGADPNSDATDDDGLLPGQDKPHGLQYWLDQIASIGTAPGRNAAPPILYLRTKADRDDEAGMATRVAEFKKAREPLLRGVEQIEFGARSSKGLERIQHWLSGKIAEVLGELGRREVPDAVFQVREELARKMRENEKAHEDADARSRETRVPVIPQVPHPTLPFDDFAEIVKRALSPCVYRDEPRLLVDLLHRSGFLFADEERLPGTLLLDQRWAIQGIYTAFDREHWQELRAVDGRCTLSQLRQWGWHAYAEEQQRLFLEFMLSCRMAFPLGDARRNREQEYVVVQALPKATELAQAALDTRGSAPPWLPIPVGDDKLGSDAVCGLLAGLGARWGRTALVWKYGGQFRSYRAWEEDDRDDPTFLHLNWRPAGDDPKSFGGTLTFSLYGPDRSFLAAVLEECRKRPDFSGVEIPAIADGPEEDPDLAKETMPGQEGKSGVATHEAPIEVRNCLEIGISFAGDRGKGITDPELLPADSHERWPRMLAKYLRQQGYTVVDYREEQERLPHQQALPKAFLERVASRDYVFAFVDWKYLESAWCMFEFERAFRNYPRADGKGVDRGRVNVAYFPEVTLSDPEAARRSANPVKRFKDHWTAWEMQEQANLDEETGTDHREYEHARSRRDYIEWFDCLQSRERLAAVIAALCDASIGRLKSTTPTAEELKRMEQCATESTGRQEILFESAVKTKQEGGADRALELFVSAFLGCDPDGQPEGLQEALERSLDLTPELDELRGLALLRLRQFEKAGKAMGDWRAFLKELRDHGKKQRPPRRSK